MLKTFLASTAAVFALTAAASAADVPADVVAQDAFVEAGDWSGFFVGVQGGYNFADFEADVAGAIIGGAAVGEFDDADDFVIGAYYGRNWQSGNWVYGLDSSISYIGLEESDDFEGTVTDIDIDADFLGLSRLKVGYAVDNLLFFVAGGLAVTRFEVEGTGVGPFEDDDDSFAFGWTIGAGVEAKIAENWSARVEFIHAQIEGDDLSLDIGALGDPVDVNLEYEANIVRGGVAYHF